MALENVSSEADGDRDGDLEVVLTAGPTDGAGVLAGVGAVIADGGVDAPPGQHAPARRCSREDPAGMSGILDPTGTVRNGLGHADRERGGEGRLMRYDGVSSSTELGTEQPLARGPVKW